MSRIFKSVSVEIDADDVLEQLDDDELLEILETRGVSGTYYSRDYAVRAYEALLGGRPSDALALLERALFPTIVTPTDYKKALAA